MRELPVEDGAQALRPDDEIAGAEVAVHEGGRSRGQVGGALGEPAQPELERRVRLAEHVDDAAVLVDELHRVLRREPGQVGDGHGVDRGRGACALRDHQRPGLGVRLVAQQLAGDRLAVDALP